MNSCNELELTKHITPHANGELLLKQSSSHVCNDSTCCLVCQRRRSVLRQVITILTMELCDVIIRTSRVRCALNMIYSTRRAFLERAMVEEILLRMFEKVSRSLKYDSKKILVHKHIYGHQPQSRNPFLVHAHRG